VLIYGSVPVTLVTMLLKNRMLQENLENALKANRELDKIRSLKDSDHKNGSTSITVYSDTSEILKFAMQDLLYIEANDNYSTFHWKNGGQVEKKMLRINLKNVEKQLNNSFAIRCHRSYIVNINAIDTVSGNTNGYKLSMMRGGLSIPLSRSKGKEVTEKIRQLRSVMEIC
jgi:DNA-binding LytR/AlgR family response regulator